MDADDVVTCFLRHRGAVLLLRRAAGAGTYPGRWGAVTGYVGDDDPRATAEREIREETGIDAAEVVRAGEAFAVRDEALGRTWRVHPFLVAVDARTVRTNDETDRAEWTSPTAILRRETVPALWRSYAAVAPTPATVAADAVHGSTAISIRALEVLRDAAGVAAVRGAGMAPVAGTARELLESRPSMAALGNRVNRAMAGADSPAAAEHAAIEGIERALDADAAAARAAAERIDGGTVLTCSRSGTVEAALRRGAGAAVVAESRPAREGVGVAERLAASGLDVTLCPDAAVAQLLADGAADAVVVGADAVQPDGRVVNKTGTRAAALAAADAGVPFLVVAASDKVRGDETLHLESGDPAAVYDGDAPIAVANPTFDVTPAPLVDGLVTERGTLDPGAVSAVAAEHRALASWRDPPTA